MSDRLHAEQLNAFEHIQRELDDSGISHESEWREVEEPLEYLQLSAEQMVAIETCGKALSSGSTLEVYKKISETNIGLALECEEREKSPRISLLRELYKNSEHSTDDQSTMKARRKIREMILSRDFNTHETINILLLSSEIASTNPEDAKLFLEKAMARVEKLSDRDLYAVIEAIGKQIPEQAEALIPRVRKYSADASHLIIQSYLERGEVDKALVFIDKRQASGNSTVGLLKDEGLISLIKIRPEEGLKALEYFSSLPSSLVASAEYFARGSHDDIVRAILARFDAALHEALVIADQNSDIATESRVKGFLQYKRRAENLKCILNNTEQEAIEESNGDELFLICDILIDRKNAQASTFIENGRDTQLTPDQEAILDLKYVRSFGTTERIQEELKNIFSLSNSSSIHAAAWPIVAEFAEGYPNESLEVLRNVYEWQFAPEKRKEFYTVLATAVSRSSLSLNEKIAIIEGRKIQELWPPFFSQMEVDPRLLSSSGMYSYVLSLDSKEDGVCTKLENIFKVLPVATGEEIDELGLKEKQLWMMRESARHQVSDDAFLKMAEYAGDDHPLTDELARKLIKLRSDVVRNSMDERYSEKVFQAISVLWNGSQEMKQWVEEQDEWMSEHLYHLHVYVYQLEDVSAQTYFPRTLERAKQEIIEEIESDESLADSVQEKFYRFIDTPYGEKFARGMVQHFSVANKFIHSWGSEGMKKKYPWLVDILELAQETINVHMANQQYDNEKYIDDEYDDEGHRSADEGFLKEDPYEKSPWIFDQGKVSKANQLIAMFRDNSRAVELAQELSLESFEKLFYIDRKISESFQKFIEIAEQSTLIPIEELETLRSSDSQFGMTNLKEVARSLVARYIIQKQAWEGGAFDEVVTNVAAEIEGLLREGFQRYLNAYAIDIPLYDKLYDEFDAVRESGRSPLEVYLGRDGVYAYLGRRAQDVARRRALGPEGRMREREAGTVLEIHPRYLVYPRYFRDNLSDQTKREFLEQEGVTPDADPLFYDTGFTGTIPEQIMRLMDFDQEEIEKRIRLLSAQTPGRRVRGVSENARNDIVTYIEHNSKLDESAIGLFKDPETGHIRPIAPPTSPTEQFYFMMIKQAISRHYWLKERRHPRLAEQLHSESDRHSVRMTRERAGTFPSVFFSHPEVYIREHGELIKGGTEEGTYPDEEIREVLLDHAPSVIAKKIELRKAREAKHEYTILIAAKKKGLPAARPVGFVAGKSREDASYLLMEKVAGISGRHFEKYLRQLERFSEAEIHTILSTVSAKNEEIAQQYRRELSVDKYWRIKDLMIDFDEGTGEVRGVTPLDWERAKVYDPYDPQEIEKLG